MAAYLFAVHDSALDAFMPPFVAAAVGQAVRSFTDAVNDPKHAFYAHPDDFVLFCLGVWDDERGELDAAQKRMVARGKDCAVREK